ncbi:MAG: terminase small subunit [Firmicutes bacterium]|nr:terminase small subunit [[Eubacterium] siraeum]MCM1487297.1 terminase small subunit [Bacillota bacterium]
MLREKQITFCNEYVRCGNASLAAKKAGYTPEYGRVLLERSEIADYCMEQGFTALERFGDSDDAREFREIMEEKWGKAGSSERKPAAPKPSAKSKTAEKKTAAKENAVSLPKREKAAPKKRAITEAAAVGEKTGPSALKKRIASPEEVLSFLTEIMEGEEALKDRLRAAELLGKRYGLFKDSADEEENRCLVIVGEDKL